MNTEAIRNTLAGIGITTDNCYPKSSFAKPDGIIYVGLFKREMLEDFYFYNTYDKKIHVFRKPENIEVYQKDNFRGSVKFLVPMDQCEVVWEEKEFIELPDDQFGNMSLRDYACIHLRYPGSNLEWLNILIKEANERDQAARSSPVFLGQR